MTKRILVCGGRDYHNWDRVFTILSSESPDEVICGGCASGADHFAAEWCGLHETPVTIYYAEWKTHGRSAGPIRNKKMLSDGKPDIVIAFPGGKGTANMVKISENCGIPVRKIDW